MNAATHELVTRFVTRLDYLEYTVCKHLDIRLADVEKTILVNAPVSESTQRVLRDMRRPMSHRGFGSLPRTVGGQNYSEGHNMFNFEQLEEHTNTTSSIVFASTCFC